jgi:anti-sigma factor RsiW
VILTCRQLVEKVTDAREGRLSAGDRAGWAAHLAWCRHCRLYVAQMDQTVEALRHGERPRASDESRARVRDWLERKRS